MAFVVTHPAPTFEAAAVMPDGTIERKFKLESLRGRYAYLLFYPMDFTFVCPTEILAFDEKLDEFEARQCSIVGISVDSPHTHAAWRRTPVTAGGIGPVGFPLVSDMSRRITESYGILFQDEVALRGLFLLDRGGVVRHAVVNDDPLGRSVDEALRTLDALRFHDEHGDVCPANWKKGQEGVKPTATGVVDYLSRYAKS
ncbi:MAG: peroxiredoxin [Deltaproteobacteria bacterium]|jgi:peroxiredoxin (alkyl hydroperoxide reductase subunit C)|nr:peroxiredoxin [Deltaproteobacteria bacterium]MBW2531408.1 peroxiredoxin [Deltaproteobacteria bacterium]